MKRSGILRVALVGGVCAASLWAGAEAQTVERNTTITGPRGRTIQRQVEVQRRPGSFERDITIRRPGGTFERDVRIQRAPVPRGGPVPGPWGRPAWVGPRPMVIEEAVPAFGFGLFAPPLLNFSFGGGGGGMAFGGGMPIGPAVAAPPPPPPDQVALECQRLQSFLSGHRKEAAYALGRLADPRAVPSLIHVLKYDNFKDVRIAAAIALGEIGGSDAAISLERSSIYDHREDVRNAAIRALDRLNAKAQARASRVREPAPSSDYARRPASPPAPEPPRVRGPASPPATSTSPFREGRAVDRPSGDADAGDALPDLSPPQGELIPPPPPAPVTTDDSDGSNP